VSLLSHDLLSWNRLGFPASFYPPSSSFFFRFLLLAVAATEAPAIVCCDSSSLGDGVTRKCKKNNLLR